MKVKDLREKFVSDLAGLYNRDEIMSFFYVLTNKYLNMSRALVAISLDSSVERNDVECFELAIKELIRFKPLQYIVGDTSFYGLNINVDENVLIPRSETEELVDWILKDIDTNKNINILDIGTGSGCIAIALKKNLPEARVTAIDVSEGALNIAKSNARLNNVEINFKQLDILDVLELKDNYDVIVSNPPYVRELEKKEIKNNVLDYEPHLALFVKDLDPLVFYIKITDLAKTALQKKGKLYFEINQYLGKETREMMVNKGFSDVELRKDINSNDRMIRAAF